MCGVSRSACRAKLRNSCTNPSDGPCGPDRGSFSNGTIVSRIKLSTFLAMAAGRPEVSITVITRSRTLDGLPIVDGKYRPRDLGASIRAKIKEDRIKRVDTHDASARKTIEQA